MVSILNSTNFFGIRLVIIPSQLLKFSLKLIECLKPGEELLWPLFLRSITLKKSLILDQFLCVKFVISLLRRCWLMVLKVLLETLLVGNKVALFLDEFLWITSLQFRRQSIRLIRIFPPKMIVEVGVEKTYDTLNWHVTLPVLTKMGFPSIQVSWINSRLNNSSFSLLVNDQPSSSRGVRQGDPISPYRFILVSQILSNMINKAKALNLIPGFYKDKIRLQSSYVCR